MPVLPLLLTLASATLYALCFPPFSLSFLAWVALAPFFLAIVQLRPRTAALYGLLWGVVMAHGVGWWFATLAESYFQASPAGGVAARFLVSVFLFGLYFSVFAAWLAWLIRRQTVNPLLVAMGWGVCEFARANLFFGNPFVLLGYSQVNHLRLMQSADISGPYGVGMLIVLVNACLAGLLLLLLENPPYPPFFKGGNKKRPLYERGPRGSTWLTTGSAWGDFSARAIKQQPLSKVSLLGQRPTVSILGVIIAVSATLGYGQWRLSQNFAGGKSIQIAVVQGAIEARFRWDPQYSQANLARYLELTNTIAATRPAVIFWPEYAVSFPLQRDLPHREFLFANMKELGADLVTGGPYYRFGVKDIHNRNSVFLIRDGTLAGRYDKLRLVPFAEDGLFSGGAASDRLPYEPGNRVQILQASTARLGVFLCFEAVYPNLVRDLALLNAEVLVNPSNDDWFGDAAPARHMLDMASVRAIEQRRYLVRPTVTGFSAVVDPYGRTVALSNFGEPSVLTAEIYPSSIQTVYGRWGDAVAWLATGIIIGVSLVYVKWLNWYTWTVPKEAV